MSIFPTWDWDIPSIGVSLYKQKLYWVQQMPKILRIHICSRTSFTFNDKMMEENNTTISLHIDKLNFVYKLHEDNQSCIEMATGTKCWPRTKLIAVEYHHLWSNVRSRQIDISYCQTDLELAYILLKLVLAKFSTRFGACYVNGTTRPIKELRFNYIPY